VERAALEDLIEVRGSGLQVQLSLQGMGCPEDFSGLNLERGDSPLLAEVEDMDFKDALCAHEASQGHKSGRAKGG
jgi:hypothetical protein